MGSKFRETINPDTMYEPPGFSHIVIPQGKKLVFISGQVAWDKDHQVMGKNDLAEQTKQVYRNLQLALNEVDATWDHIAKTTVYTTRPQEYETIGEVTSEFFGETPPPAQTLVGVTALASSEFLVEIEATVVMDEK